MNNVSSYFGLTDSGMIGSEKDLPVVENECKQYSKNKRTQGGNHLMK